MAASRMALCLLGLVVVAAAFAAAEAGTACTPCGGGGGGSLEVLLNVVVNLKKCKPAVLVEVGAVVSGKGVKVCPGGEATSLAPLTVNVAVVDVVTVTVVVLGKRGKPELTVLLELDLLKLGVKVVNGRYHLQLDVEVDVKLQQLLFLCHGVRVHVPIDLRLYLELFGLLRVGLP